MIFNFMTDDRSMATAALLVYAIYRSRDKRRFKVHQGMWGQIDRYVKASAKRATNLPRFIDALMPKLECPHINPRWTKVGIRGGLIMVGDSFMEFPNADHREFLAAVIQDADHKAVIDILYKETSWVINLVCERLEREKPIENTFDIEEESL